MLKDRVIDAIAKTLKLDARELDNLRQDVGYKRLQKWTSARHAEIIVALEDEFSVEIDEQSIPRLNDVPKIVDFLQRRLGP